MKDEEFKPVLGYEGKYSVSNYGTVVSHPTYSRNCDRALRQTISREGYLLVTLYKDTKRSRKTYGVHTLVVKAFIRNYKKPYQCNHKNGIKIDNSLENLEIITHKENIRHAYKLGLCSNVGSRNNFSILNEYKVRNIKKCLNEKIYSIKQLSEIYKVSYHTIYKIKVVINWSNV